MYKHTYITNIINLYTCYGRAVACEIIPGSSRKQKPALITAVSACYIKRKAAWKRGPLCILVYEPENL